MHHTWVLPIGEAQMVLAADEVKIVGALELPEVSHWLNSEEVPHPLELSGTVIVVFFSQLIDLSHELLLLLVNLMKL